MNLSDIQVLSGESLYKRRKPRADFAGSLKPDEEVRELERLYEEHFGPLPEYSGIKREYNRLMLELEPEISRKIRQAPDLSLIYIWRKNEYEKSYGYGADGGAGISGNIYFQDSVAFRRICPSGRLYDYSERMPAGNGPCGCLLYTSRCV